MRRSLIVAATATALLCVAPFTATAATAAPKPKPVPATVRSVVRPVTASGHAVAGYRVTKVKDATVSCSAKTPSPAAVDDDILYCSPDAANALACWRAAAPHHVLCLDQANRKSLTELRTTGRIAHVTAPRRRGPLNLKLANGDFCGLRDGGTANALRGHPNWYISYYCTHGQAVWAPHHFGISRGHVWHVRVANASGKQQVHSVRVTRAWLVGTAA